MKRSVNFSGMGGKNGRYARSIQGLVDSLRAVGMRDDEIRAALLEMQAEQQAAARVRQAGQGDPELEQAAVPAQSDVGDQA